MYLVDTSVWIDFLKNNQNSKVHFLETLLEEGEAYLCEVTYAEICFGAKDKRQFQKYAQEFSNLPFLNLPNHWHQEIAEMGHTLKMNGFKPYLADLQIALTTLTHQAILLTQDRDFEAYQKLFGLVIE